MPLGAKTWPVDEESFEEGSHVADVDIRLCSECEEKVGDSLLYFVERQTRKGGEGARINMNGGVVRRTRD